MNTVELGAFTLTQLSQIQATGRTTLVGDSHTYVTPTDNVSTVTQYKPSQQSYNFFIPFMIDNPLAQTLRYPPTDTPIPIGMIPNIPDVFNARSHSCKTCNRKACVCAHMVSLSITNEALSLPEEGFYTPHNSSYRLTLMRGPDLDQAPINRTEAPFSTVLHTFSFPVGPNRDYAIYKASPPHFLQIPPNSFFVLDGPVVNTQMHSPILRLLGYPDPQDGTPLPTIAAQLLIASAL